MIFGGMTVYHCVPRLLWHVARRRGRRGRVRSRRRWRGRMIPGLEPTQAFVDKAHGRMYAGSAVYAALQKQTRLESRVTHIGSSLCDSGSRGVLDGWRA